MDRRTFLATTTGLATATVAGCSRDDGGGGGGYDVGPPDERRREP